MFSLRNTPFLLSNKVVRLAVRQACLPLQGRGRVS